MIHICESIGFHDDCRNAAPRRPKQRVLPLSLACTPEDLRTLALEEASGSRRLPGAGQDAMLNKSAKASARAQRLPLKEAGVQLRWSNQIAGEVRAWPLMSRRTSRNIRQGGDGGHVLQLQRGGRVPGEGQ